MWFSLMNFRESDITKERIMKIINAGAKVILVTGGIDELCQKYCLENGVMAVRRCRKVDLKRIAKATGGQLLSCLINMDGEETFEASMLGEAEEVIQERVADDELILIKGLDFFPYSLLFHFDLFSFALFAEPKIIIQHQ